MKAKRQAVLVELIARGLVESQQSALEELRKRGIPATQATVSRDLDDLGAVKVRKGEGIRYELLEPRSDFGPSVGQVLRDFVVSLTVSGNLVVLRTPPGHAAAVAAAIDRAQLTGILGTVAGDDTLFICASEELTGRGAAKLLEGLDEKSRPRPHLVA